MDAMVFAPLLVGAALLAPDLSWVFKESLNAKALLDAIRKLLVSGNLVRAIKLCSATDASLARVIKELLLQGAKLSSTPREIAEGAVSLHFEEHEKRLLARVSLWRLNLGAWALVLLAGILSVKAAPVWFIALFGLEGLMALGIELKSRQMVIDLRSYRAFFTRELSLLTSTAQQ